MSDDTRINDPAEPPPEEPNQGWWQARSGLQKTLIIGGGILLILILIGLLVDNDDGDPEAGGSSTTAVGGTTTTGAGDPSTTSGDVTTTAPEVTTTAAPTTTTLAPTTTVALFDPVIAQGSGDDVIDFVVPGNAPSVLALTHDGSSNFAVVSYTSEGETIDLLVNTIGSYDGNVPINLLVGEEVAELEITADGAWTATATSVLAAPDFDTTYEGTGDDVVQYLGTGTRLAVTHDGESNFVVMAYGASVDLLVNEIGPYSGTVRIPDGTILFSVNADGAWTFASE